MGVTDPLLTLAACAVIALICGQVFVSFWNRWFK